MSIPTTTSRRKAGQAGGIILEFAIIALVVYVVFAGIVEMGRVIMSGQILQAAARSGARELSLTPLPADATFDTAMVQPDVLQRVFDPRFLVINLDSVSGSLDSYFAQLPVINRLLRPLMIYDNPTFSVSDGSGGTTIQSYHLLRYPGTLLREGNWFTVRIPRVDSRDSSGVETISWLPVVGEARVDPADPNTGSFSVSAPAPGTYSSPLRGTVALVIYYPFQSSLLTGYRPNATDPMGVNSGNYNIADDSSVNAGGGGIVTYPTYPFGSLSLASPIDSAGAYGGVYGLGKQYARGTTVRPYRSLLSAQSIYQREVFQ